MTAKTNDYTLFVQAALSEDLERLQQMLDGGFDINHSEDDGETAFSWCCEKNVLRSAQFLHANGADINAPLGGVTSPLDVAVCRASPEFRSWLRSVGGKRCCVG